jgi:phosphoribosylaminoimidazole (AIR) synthetase
VNDILTTGAEPLYFLDYIATHKVVPEIIEQIVKGISASIYSSFSTAPTAKPAKSYSPS